MGFAGVQNFPTVGLVDGMFRLNLEETGMGFDGEIEMIAWPTNSSLLTSPVCLRRGTGARDDPGRGRPAGSACRADHEGLHRREERHDIGTRQQPSFGALSRLEKTSAPTCSFSVTAGPLPNPKTLAWIVDHTRDLDGFFGASSIERLATEVAITEQTRRFKSLRHASKPAPLGTAIVESRSGEVKDPT